MSIVKKKPERGNQSMLINTSLQEHSDQGLESWPSQQSKMLAAQTQGLESGSQHPHWEACSSTECNVSMSTFIQTHAHIHK